MSPEQLRGETLDRGEPACAAFVEQIPFLKRFRTYPEIQAVISKYRAR